MAGWTGEPGALSLPVGEAGCIVGVPGEATSLPIRDEGDPGGLWVGEGGGLPTGEAGPLPCDIASASSPGSRVSSSEPLSCSIGSTDSSSSSPPSLSTSASPIAVSGFTTPKVGSKL